MIRTYLFCIAAIALSLNFTDAAMTGEPAGDKGTILELSNGQRLQVFIEDKQIHAYFIDSENMVVESNGESIVFVIDDPGHKSDKWRTLLKPVEGQGFTSTRRLYAPYEFRTRIIVRFVDEDPITLSKKALDLDKMLQQSVSDDS